MDISKADESTLTLEEITDSFINGQFKQFHNQCSEYGVKKVLLELTERDSNQFTSNMIRNITMNLVS